MSPSPQDEGVYTFFKQIQQRYFARYQDLGNFQFEELRRLLPCAQSQSNQCSGRVIEAEIISQHPTSIACPCFTMKKKCLPLFESGFLNPPALEANLSQVAKSSWNEVLDSEQTYSKSRQFLMTQRFSARPSTAPFPLPLPDELQKSWKFFQKLNDFQEKIFEDSYYLSWPQAKKFFSPQSGTNDDFISLKKYVLNKKALVLAMGSQKLRIKAGTNIELATFEQIVKELDLNGVGLIVFTTQPLEVNIEKMLTGGVGKSASLGLLQIMGQGMQDRLMGVLSLGQKIIDVNR